MKNDVCPFAGIKKDNASKDIIFVTCIHDKTLPINQARRALGLPPMTIEEQERQLEARIK